jgi:hypothetical protein
MSLAALQDDRDARVAHCPDIPSEVDRRAGLVPESEDEAAFSAMSTIFARVFDVLLAGLLDAATVGRKTVVLAALLQHPRVRDTNIVELARDTGVTKQAISKLAKELSAELRIVARWQRSRARRKGASP